MFDVWPPFGLQAQIHSSWWLAFPILFHIWFSFLSEFTASLVWQHDSLSGLNWSRWLEADPRAHPYPPGSSDFCLLQPKHTPHDSAWRNYIFNQWMPRLLYPSDNSETHVSQSFPVGLSSVTHSGKLRDNTPSVGCLPFPAVQVAFMSMPVVY